MRIEDDLRLRLDGYSPDRAEALHVTAMRTLLARGSLAFDASEFDPGHFTASAFVVSPSGRDLLLIHHAKLDRWLQPGGHVESGDATMEAAARRELAEETGVANATLARDGVFDVDVHVIPAARVPAHSHFDVRFLLRATSDALTPSTEVKAARWVPLDEVSALESDASVMRAVEKIRAWSRVTRDARALARS